MSRDEPILSPPRIYVDEKGNYIYEGAIYCPWCEMKFKLCDLPQRCHCSLEYKIQHTVNHEWIHDFKIVVDFSNRQDMFEKVTNNIESVRNGKILLENNNEPTN